ncbi:50S ribosomal protein L17 [Candidatus Nomurabacteria bacterium]|nr:50S ribosomal protein L17 [Candidatus Nomurabacteria bacterium]
MRHNSKKSTLGREKAHRDALMRNLAQSLILHGAITTTQAKAKALRSVVEPLVTKAKAGKLHDRRSIMKVLYTQEAVNKLIHDIAPNYKDRNGGYTRIVKIGPRRNDGADMAKIEFVD